MTVWVIFFVKKNMTFVNFDNIFRQKKHDFCQLFVCMIKFKIIFATIFVSNRTNSRIIILSESVYLNDILLFI